MAVGYEPGIQMPSEMTDRDAVLRPGFPGTCNAKGPRIQHVLNGLPTPRSDCTSDQITP